MRPIVNQTTGAASQLGLFGAEENPEYLTSQLITYIGNKRSLLTFIGSAADSVRSRIGKDKLDVIDLFSGSGVVARYFKRYSRRLVANDLEPYCEITNRCYLANRPEIDLKQLRTIHEDLTDRLHRGPLIRGVIATNYAPEDDTKIMPGERVFFTSRNARYLDTARALIDEVPQHLQHFFLAPLLSEASIHANTSGVFKGFYKDAATGIGKFGGSNSDALLRIKGEITLPLPVFSNFSCDVEVDRSDANTLVREVGEFDLAYLDPPYNQHPYGSNYFMLNLLLKNTEPTALSRVSGIPTDWQRSDYNRPQAAHSAFLDLVENLSARFILVSFNSEGFISQDGMVDLLSSVGNVDVLETKYNTFRGSRNLRNRSIHVKEFLYLVEKR